MSVATEFAPSVFIPERARAARPGTALDGAEVRPLASMSLASVSVLRAPSTASVPAAVRLTRRGVVVVAIAVAVLALAVVWLAAASASGSVAAPASGTAASSVTVQPGDTLWSIATRAAPARDPRAEVAVLQKLNALDSVDLVPGQVLRLR